MTGPVLVDKSFEESVITQSRDLMETASQMSVQVYLFVALNTPIVKDFLKKQNYEAAKELLNTIESQILKEKSKKA
jgi:hypothetical protein